jgi:hypothetical protein
MYATGAPTGERLPSSCVNPTLVNTIAIGLECQELLIAVESRSPFLPQQSATNAAKYIQIDKKPISYTTDVVGHE